MPKSEKQRLHLEKLANSRRIYKNQSENIKAWRKRNPEHFNALRRKYYHNNPKIYREIDRRKRQKRLAKLWELKNVPCRDCGGIFPPYVMHFDHIRGQKNGCVSRMNSYKTMIEESKKCEVVCANCHAIRTWERKNHGKGV